MVAAAEIEITVTMPKTLVVTISEITTVILFVLMGTVINVAMNFMAIVTNTAATMTKIMAVVKAIPIDAAIISKDDFSKCYSNVFNNSCCVILRHSKIKR